MAQECCPPARTDCVASVRIQTVCLVLNPARNSKIKATRTTTILADCSETVTYVAEVASYNPRTGYTRVDEVPCGTGEFIPFSSGNIAGDATAANQVLQLAQETGINSKLPATLGQKAMAASMAVVIASDQTRIPTDNLGRPTVSRQLTAAATSTPVDLTSGVTRISILARLADIRFRVATVAGGALVAVVTDHLIMQNERLDINVQSVGRIAAIRDAATSGTLEITELG